MSLPTSPPKRLAFVITELEPGGAERCLVELATRIDRSRFSPLVISLAAAPATDKQSLVARLKDAGIPTTFLGFQRGWDYFAAVRRLTEVLQTERIDLVQTFLFHANVVGTKAAVAAKVPHVFTGMRVADPRKWRLIIERWATAQAKRFVCVSQNVAEAYRWAGFDSEKLAVVPNGIELSRFETQPSNAANSLGLPAGRHAILFVGRLDKQKGLDRFFHELPVIFRALPNHDLVLVGDGPLKSPLIRLASRLRIADRVHFLGWQPDATPFISAADILILPSRWEGMPNVVLEAMAAGKPVVATQAEGTVELLGIAAIDQTAAVGDWPGLRQRLIEIGQNPELSADLGRRNRSRAAQFSIQAMVQRYERLYDAVFASK
jgi:glycosyltransferase involved in cell wall biosynthesis